MEYKAEIIKQIKELHEQGYHKICFYHPAYNVGGGPNYYLALAKYLVEHTDLEVYYLNYEGGYPNEKFVGTNIKPLVYHDDDIDFPLKEKCIIITNSTRAILLTRMNPENRLLFWHYETVRCAWKSVFIMGETKKYLECTRAKKAMVFHDWSGWDALSMDLGKEFDQAYLPLFLPPKEGKAKQELINENEIRIGWVGRLANEKRFSIYNILDRFAEYETEKKKIFYIIGDGFFADEVHEYCQKNCKDVICVFPGTVNRDKLDQYLCDNVDVLFAMGLSVLEGAALGIPSVAVLLDTETINTDCFWWICHTKDYCCGILPSQKDRFNIQYTTFNSIMDEIYVQKRKKELSEKCYNHYLKHFSDFDEVIWLFLQGVLQSSMYMKDLEECIRYVPYKHVRVKEKAILGYPLSRKVYTVNG